MEKILPEDIVNDPTLVRKSVDGEEFVRLFDSTEYEYFYSPRLLQIYLLDRNNKILYWCRICSYRFYLDDCIARRKMNNG